MKTTLLSLLFSTFWILLTAQPTNDFCEGAIALDEEFIAELCVDNGWRSITAELDGATASPNLTDCVLQSTPTVWFVIPPSALNYLLSIRISGEPGAVPAAQVFSGTCDNLNLVHACAVGYTAPLYVMDVEIDPTKSTYIVFGDVAHVAQTLTLSWSKRAPGSPCVTIDELKPVYRSGGQPFDGPYFPGDTIGFNYQVYFQVSTGVQNCQWMHGVVPIFGNGWDPTSFDSNGQPVVSKLNNNDYPAPGVHNSSTWDWHLDAHYHHPKCDLFIGDFDGNGSIDLCDGRYDPTCAGATAMGGCCGPCWQDNSGDQLPGGWFAVGVNGSCGSLSGYPDVDWGDGNTCNGLNGPWNFYFELIVPPGLTSGQEAGAFSIVMHTFADGETGSWTGGPSVCGQDYPERYDASVIVGCTGDEGRAYLSGVLFADLEEDCNYDGNEPRVPWKIVQIKPVSSGETQLLLTDNHGFYQAELDTGSYWIVPVLEGIEPQMCPDSVLVHVSTPCEPYFVPMAVDNDALCGNVLALTMNSTWFSPCRKRQMVLYAVNTSDIEFTGSEIELELDTFLNVKYISEPYTAIGTNVFQLHLGTLGVGESRRISIQIETSCLAPLGQLICNNATLTTTECAALPIYTFRCSAVMAAVDPNFKVDASDFSFGTTTISDNSPIEYQIHFQNTGTAPAQRVTILDTLPEYLDASTFQFQGSTHSAEVSLLENHILQFYFDNIQLPDSTADEPGSHGAITYTIRPVDGLVSGDVFLNGASIYFDFSPPVATNLKRHEVTCAPDENTTLLIQPLLCTNATLEFLGNIYDRFHTHDEIVIPGVAGNGCDSVYIVDLIFFPAIGFDSAIVSLDDGTGIGAIELYPLPGTEYTYMWSTGSTANGIHDLSVGEYTVTITDTNGCSEVFTYVVELNSATDDVDKDTSIFLQPNPAGEYIDLVFEQSPGRIHVSFISISGQVVFDETLSAESISRIDVRDLTSGLYLVRVQGSQGVRMLKFVRR